MTPSPAHGLDRELYRKLVDFISARDHIDLIKAEQIIATLTIGDLTMLETQARGAVISHPQSGDGTRSGNRNVAHAVVRDQQAMFTSGMYPPADSDPFA